MMVSDWVSSPRSGAVVQSVAAARAVIFVQI